MWTGDARCPRQNGVYASSDPYECDTYYSCLNGKSSPTKCAPGLHYSDEIGTCVWPRESGREDCISEEAGAGKRKRKNPKSPSGAEVTTKAPAAALANGFKCPGGPVGVHPALPHPSDCRLYYVCLDGLTPSEAGCTKGRVFNPSSQQCDKPENVAGCEFYYNPALKKKTEEENAELASELGADITGADFNQFLKLLRMSGVLGGRGEAALRRPAGRPGPRPGRRPRPGGPRRGRPRPVRPHADFYDYDYADSRSLEFQAEPRRAGGAGQGLPGRRPGGRTGPGRRPPGPAVQVTMSNL